MLIQFSVNNFKSFKDSAILSMSATQGKENPDNVMETVGGRLLRSAEIYGANAAGKSNIISAISAAILIIRTSDSRQVNAPIPFVDPFCFCKEKGEAETSFEFEFIMSGRKYIYGFTCTKTRITAEYLIAYNSRKPSKIFSRKDDQYTFTDSAIEKILKPLTVRNTSNKNFLTTATTWNAEVTRPAFIWFSTYIDTYDLSVPMVNSLELYEADKDNTLRGFTKRLLSEADINIVDYSVESRKVDRMVLVNMPPGARSGKEYRVMTKHIVDNAAYELPLQNESKGTQSLFFLSPQIKNALDNGRVFCVDELDASIHPSLLLYLVSIFNNPERNPNGAQLIMTTHTTEVLSIDVMRRDQIFFVEKDNKTGVSELYSLDEFPVRTREDIRKAYLSGKYGAVPNIV